MAVLGERMNKLDADKKAESETMNLLKFVGDWHQTWSSHLFALTDYEKEFGRGYLYSLSIGSIGLFLIEFYFCKFYI